MEYIQDLIEILREDGIEPTDVTLARLDAQITDLAEILVDYWIYEKKKHNRSSFLDPDTEMIGAKHERISNNK
jgi:hypothetical protein